MKAEEIVEKIFQIIEKAKKLGTLINPNVLELVIRNNFKCLCKVNTECPCKESEKEVKEMRRCYCGLFVKVK